MTINTSTTVLWPICSITKPKHEDRKFEKTEGRGRGVMRFMLSQLPKVILSIMY